MLGAEESRSLLEKARAVGFVILFLRDAPPGGVGVSALDAGHELCLDCRHARGSDYDRNVVHCRQPTQGLRRAARPHGSGRLLRADGEAWLVEARDPFRGARHVLPLVRREPEAPVAQAGWTSRARRALAIGPAQAETRRRGKEKQG